MKITVIAVGKLKEKFWKEACSEYQKRLGAFCDLKVLEVLDAPTNAGSGIPAPEAESKDISSKLAKIATGNSKVIALCIDCKQQSSEEFAAKISEFQNSGISHLIFIIGGSAGLADNIIAKSDEQMSLGKITLPHNLARVVLLEQTYRACMINARRTYHK